MLQQARLAEVVAALSMAIDMGSGRESGRSLVIALLAQRLGTELGMSEAERSDLYYTTLLAMLGCTAESSEAADIFGDEIAFGAMFSPLVMAPRGEMMAWMLRSYASDDRFARRVRRVGRLLTEGKAFFEQSSAGHCEVARRLTDRLGVSRGVDTALGSVFERWDGNGGPRRLRGEQVPLPIRVIHVAWEVQTFGSVGGQVAWTGMLRRRAGRTLDPAVVDAALGCADELDDLVHVASPWDEGLAAEPNPQQAIADADAVASVIADFVDLKSDHLHGHSRAVAAIAGAAAAHLGLDAARVDTVRRAGLVHDLGRVAVSTGIWDKPAPLSDAEWELVRLHPYHGERILCRTALLAAPAAIAGAHHERCDGSGYHRGAAAAALSAEARVLAAADAFAAMTESRAHRPARSAEDAARELAADAQRGLLDAQAVEAVVEAAGQRVEVERTALRGGLTGREVEVLALLARGMATKQVAAQLGISAKTADHHVQSAYRKAGVSTRAGATVFAMEHGLVGGWGELPMASPAGRA
jgi:HD-GYP domain-containing protein (c-di-GMP phosphodiesterase class II)